MKERNTIITKLPLILFICFLFFGCAVTKKVNISSAPPEVELYIDGVKTGVTPMTKEFSFEKKESYEVLAKKEGYEDAKTTISLEPREKTRYHLELKQEAVTLELLTVEPEPTEKGVKLAVVRKPTIAYLDVIERSPNVRSVSRVTHNEDPMLQIDNPVLSPVDDVLVYQIWIEEEDGNSYSNIWKQKIGFVAKTRVTFGKWRDLFPAFTPNGEYLIFSSNRIGKNPILWMIKTKGGGGITKITDSLAEDYAPSVSPDGNLIGYSSNPPNVEEPQIWTISSTGRLPTQLREGEHPKISPDGRKILFVRRDKISNCKQIWLMGIDGGEETLLSSATDHNEISPDWSPDGRWIVFTSNESIDLKEKKNFDIWLMKSDGSQRTQLTTNGSHDDCPVWDRSGKIIYFRSNRGGAWNIWKMYFALD